MFRARIHAIRKTVSRGHLFGGQTDDDFTSSMTFFHVFISSLLSG